VKDDEENETGIWVRLLPFLMLLGIPVMLLDLRVVGELAVFYSAVGTGSVSAIFAGVGLGLHPLSAASVVAYIESIYSSFITIHYHLLLKIPLLGPLLAKYNEKAKKVLNRPIVKRLELMGIFSLMFIPTFGTGAITMSLVGRTLGIKWWKVWITVTLASAIRSVIIAGIAAGFISLVI